MPDPDITCWPKSRRRACVCLPLPSSAVPPSLSPSSPPTPLPSPETRCMGVHGVMPSPGDRLRHDTWYHDMTLDLYVTTLLDTKAWRHGVRASGRYNEAISRSKATHSSQLDDRGTILIIKGNTNGLSHNMCCKRRKTQGPLNMQPGDMMTNRRGVYHSRKADDNS